MRQDHIDDMALVAIFGNPKDFFAQGKSVEIDVVHLPEPQTKTCPEGLNLVTGEQKVCNGIFGLTKGT